MSSVSIALRLFRRVLARPSRVVVLGLLALAVGLPQAPAEAEPLASASQLCLDQTMRQERLTDIPAHVLTAISMVESGRWDGARQARVAWPWTVTNGGSGKFFPTKAEAIAHARALQARGEWNIDVGCMQINLHYHGDAFATLEKAFEPKANVAYAAEFLMNLHRETGSWTQAVSRYHSRTPHLAERYMGKFRIAWREAEEFAVVANLPPVTDIKAEAEAIAAAREAERARLLAEQEAEREAARAYAEDWRAEKVRAWLARRDARAEGEGDNAS
ncbi:transglycosylase SLT domain-containing protein [Roseospira navarrensis]|uniref:transglycosylase SLT domain-containing protein n=1 Tax=Roseospira navarrensis TaxID=140058 RepID=UPI001FE7F58F|nr:transglycosylase SLT domain-containing protein [Roseospira navarrensis]